MLRRFITTWLCSPTSCWGRGEIYRRTCNYADAEYTSISDETNIYIRVCTQTSSGWLNSSASGLWNQREKTILVNAVYIEVWNLHFTSHRSGSGTAVGCCRVCVCVANSFAKSAHKTFVIPFSSMRRLSCQGMAHAFHYLRRARRRSLPFVKYEKQNIRNDCESKLEVICMQNSASMRERDYHLRVSACRL